MKIYEIIILLHRLKYFNIEHINLLSNNPSKFEGLKQYGIDIAEELKLSFYQKRYIIMIIW